MPPTESVSLAVTTGNRSDGSESADTLKFTPDNWMRFQTLVLSGYKKTLRLKFTDKHLGSAAVADLDAIDPRLGKVVTFDRPMLPTGPEKFGQNSE